MTGKSICYHRKLILKLHKVVFNKIVLIWIFFGLGIVISFVIYQHLLSISLLCSNADIHASIIPKMCQDADASNSKKFHYSIDNEEFSSLINLCSALCAYKLEISCHKFHLNKEMVYTVYYTTLNNNSEQIVMKSVILQEDTDAYWNKKTASPYIPTTNEVRSMVDTYIYSVVGRLPDGLLSDIRSYLLLFKVVDLKVHENFWKFIYDHEFLISYLFSNFEVFPKIVGTCQNFYGVEYAKPLIINPLLPINIPSYERISKSIELLRFMDKLQTMWVEPVHLCDIKHDHFGWKMDGLLVFLDLDCVETDSSLKNIMLSMPECSNDDDCSYFDCHGQCLPSQRCSGNRVNTNLQILCSKIFLGYSDSSVIAMSGLLLNFHYNKNLKEALELCAMDPAATTNLLVKILQELLPHYYNDL